MANVSAVALDQHESAHGLLSNTERKTLTARLIEIIRERSFQKGSFTLSSGRTSSRYFNLKPTMLDGEASTILAKLTLDIAATENFDAVGGLELGAVPIICSLASTSHILYPDFSPPIAFIVRKRRKEHGANLLIEGLAFEESLEGMRCLILDDVATTGKSVMQAVEAVRAAGGTVDTVAVIVDREEGAAEFFEEQGLSFRPLIKASEVDPEGEPAR